MDTPEAGKPLTYEETPIIESVPAPAAPKPSGSYVGTVGTTLLFLVLFSIGVGGSVALRRWLASRTVPSAPSRWDTPPSTPTPSFTPDVPSTFNGKDVRTPQVDLAPTPTIADSYAGWKTQEVMPGVSFRLPPDVQPAGCDGASCASQGTYLPHGTRFTLAPRGKGHPLVDARGNIVITDSSGKPFTMKHTTLSDGRNAIEYSGVFSGTTVGGYTFSQMRGLMIEIDEDETLEVNHFTPSGVAADFAEDDVLFDKIVASLTVATGR